MDIGECQINDDIKNIVIPELISSDIIILASPVYFNNVSSYAKILIDRTFCIKGKLRNKVGGAVVVGRGYGLESALQAIYSWMLKHRMIIGCPGLQSKAFKKKEVLADKQALTDIEKFVERIAELASMIKK